MKPLKKPSSTHEVAEAILSRTNADVRRKFDTSAARELANYARHEIVEDLETAQLEAVLRRLAELAEGTAVEQGRKTVGGKDVRVVIMYLCSQTFGSCDEASRRILSDEVGPTDDIVPRIAALSKMFDKQVAGE